MRREQYARASNSKSVQPLVRKAIAFHVLNTKDETDSLAPRANQSKLPPQEELVEDAGLYQPEPEFQLARQTEGGDVIARSG